jgi:DNA (cytosine-5)-methyltransferase 1
LIDQPAHERTVRWAIADLPRAANGDLLHRPSRVSDENRLRIQWLFENAAYDLPNRLRPACHRLRSHTYKSVYGRLQWDAPSQTITTGFGSMGQGRYVHPRFPRTLTEREAARLQFIPDFFDLAVAHRTARREMIGNAVPPKLTLEFGKIVISALA